MLLVNMLKISKKLAKIHSIGKILVHPGLRKMSKILILTDFIELNMLWDVICSFAAKKARFEGEEKIIEKSRKLLEKSRKLVEKSRKSEEKSRASWKINTIITF